MQQVADHAGVSISTVSFVVNGTKPVTPETRERIVSAIEQLGYRRNEAARTLASRRSKVLALAYPLIDRNLNTFIEAAADAAAAAGYSFILWPIRTDNEAQEVTSLIKRGVADGVLLLEVRLDDERVARLLDANAPFALIGRTRDPSRLDYVDVDFERSISDVVDRFVALGHRHITLVTEDLADTPLAGFAPPTRMEETFTARVVHHGLHPTTIRVGRHPEAEAQLVDRLAAEAPNTTAIAMMHESASFRLLNGLRARGIRVPEDTSVVAVAGSSTFGALADPSITTWESPGRELGRRGAEALIHRLEEPTGPLTQILLPCAEVPGGSLGPAL